MNIKTPYITDDLNSPIELFTGNLVPIVKLENQEGAFVAGEGRVFVKWFPHPRIAFELSYDSQKPVMLNQGLPVPVQVMRASTTQTTSTEPVIYTGELRGTLRQSVFESSKQPLSAFLFSLPNFHLAHQSAVHAGVERPAPSTMDAQVIGWEDWVLSLSSIFQPSIYDELHDEGGFAVTHVGMVQRWDAGHTAPTFFSEDEIEPMLRMMRGIFGFARGFRCGPILPLGFDMQSQECWRKWEHPMVAAWKPVASWFDAESPDWLARLWPGFSQRWNDPFWSETVHLAVYWYLECNAERNAEGSVILAQTALERLAWMKLVKESPHLTSTQFRGRASEQKLGMLLNEMGIPLEIPGCLSGLRSLAAREGWPDGPTAWIKVRNNIVHPDNDWEPGFSSLDATVLGELLDLGMWYLELCLLRLFDYSGPYVNRLIRDIHAQRIEPVPWA